jgi:hypothetical protein
VAAGDEAAAGVAVAVGVGSAGRDAANKSVAIKRARVIFMGLLVDLIR